MAPDNSKPEPCYPSDVETLREMLKEERERESSLGTCAAEYRAKWGDRTPLSAALTWNMQRTGQRVEALRTAIEVMGGAL